MNEVWKDVPGYEGVYAISNLGRLKVLEHTITRRDGKVYSFKEKIVHPRITRGYEQATLSYVGKRHFIGVHRLVALAFIPNPSNKPEVNHRDGNKLNNRIDNLEWVTSSENVKHAFDHRLKKPNKGNSKLTDNQVKYIKDCYENRKSRFWGKKKIAQELNISMSTIDCILCGKTWSEV